MKEVAAQKNRRKTWLEFHAEKMKRMMEKGDLLMKLPDFESRPDSFYSRSDESGWWMYTKESLIDTYIEMYLNIWRKKDRIPRPTIVLFDLLSGPGMNKVTKNGGRHAFIFPGSTLLAVLQSQTDKAFDAIYTNDKNSKYREYLSNRLDSFYSHARVKSRPKCNILYYNSMDSNAWVLAGLEIAKGTYGSYKYLAIIDNQGFAIKFDTLKRMWEINNAGDFIITFQDQEWSRFQVTNKDRAELFMGKTLSQQLTSDQALEEYCSQLKSIGFQTIETIPIKGPAFHYTLIFACRLAKAGWFQAITNYKNGHYASWDDKKVKLLWNIINQKQSVLFPSKM